MWIKKRKEKGFEDDFWLQMNLLGYYKKLLKKGKSDSDDKILKILRHKQFFSIPWLICFDSYLT